DTSKAEMDLHPETARLAKQVVSLMRAEARGLRPAGERTQRGKAAKVLMFPYYTDGMAELLARLRAAVPEAFPRRVRGVSGGAAFHVFRHTVATELARRGLREQDLMRLLRHKNFATTTAYVGAIRGREQPTDVLRKAWADEAAEEAAALGQAPGIPTAGIGNPGQSVAGGVVTLKGRGK
ncbi:MAG: site-specific integrase, partial [Archangium sp.]